MISDTLTIRGETFHVASWPVRIAAKVIDLAFCYGIIFFGLGLLPPLLPEAWFFFLFIPFFFAVMAWWFTSDGLLRGAGLGKRLLGLRLVHRRHGSRPSAGEATIRQLKYSTFFSLWGLVTNAHDEKHGTTQPDEFVTVKKARPASDLAALAPPLPPHRPLDVKDLGHFLADKYSHGKRPPS
jgi:uncharacterized RDD family membrane protein YckC